MVTSPTEQNRQVDACTIGAATGSATRTGDPIVFGNSDDPFTTRTRLVVVKPPDGLRFIATQIISPPPSVSFNEMHTRGLNEAGFAYTWAYVMPEREPNDREAIGIPLNQLGRLLLSRARSIDDAIELVQAYPRAYHGNFIFADASGEVALVEISTQSMHVETRSTDGLIARANHWISDAMRHIGCDNPAVSSIHRYRRARTLLKAQRHGIDASSLRAVLADHGGREETGYSICAHGSAEHWGGTVSSEIIEPRAGRFWYCYGWPCGEQPEAPESQLYQDRSWGIYLPFDLEALEAGEYVTIDGRLTPFAVRQLIPSPLPVAGIPA